MYRKRGSQRSKLLGKYCRSLRSSGDSKPQTQGYTIKDQ